MSRLFKHLFNVLKNYFIITPFSAAIAFKMASPLLGLLVGFLRASFNSFFKRGSFFCRASASVCHARQRIFSNSVCSRCCVCSAMSFSSYGVYSPTVNGSTPKTTTALSHKADKSIAAVTFPPSYHLSRLHLRRMRRSELHRAFLRFRRCSNIRLLNLPPVRA